MISRRHKKFAKIGKKKRKKRWYMPYVYIILFFATLYSLTTLVFEYYKEKAEFLKETNEREK
jgi:hypothetical protein